MGNYRLRVTGRQRGGPAGVVTSGVCCMKYELQVVGTEI